MGLNKSILVISVSVIYLVFFFALSSGLVNALLQYNEIPKGFLVIPNRSIQTITETFAFVVILFIGVGGVVLLYRSGSTSKIKNQYSLLGAGFVLLLISIGIGFWLLKIKV